MSLPFKFGAETGDRPTVTECSVLVSLVVWRPLLLHNFVLYFSINPNDFLRNVCITQPLVFNDIISPMCGHVPSDYFHLPGMIVINIT